MTIVSNCEEVEIIIGEYNLGKFLPDLDNYPHLPLPPFTIPINLQFTSWGGAGTHDLHLIGYIAGETVMEQQIASNKLPAKLELSLDS